MAFNRTDTSRLDDETRHFNHLLERISYKDNFFVQLRPSSPMVPTPGYRPEIVVSMVVTCVDTHRLSIIELKAIIPEGCSDDNFYGLILSKIQRVENHEIDEQYQVDRVPFRNVHR